MYRIFILAEGLHLNSLPGQPFFLSLSPMVPTDINGKDIGKLSSTLNIVDIFPSSEPQNSVFPVLLGF